MWPSDKSFVPVPPVWLSCWEDVTVDVEGAPVLLTCATMLVTAAATLACEGTGQGAVVLGGEAGTISSIPSSVNSSRSEEEQRPAQTAR